MSEIIGSPIAVMQRVLTQEIRSIPQKLLTPTERVNHLFDAVKSRESDLASHGRAILGLTINAVDDMWFIGAGALGYAEEVLPDDSLRDHITLVKRSIPRLVFPALLSDRQWQSVRAFYSSRDIKGKFDERRQLNTDSLILVHDNELQLPVISFSSGPLADMDSRIDVSGFSGCPAQGVVIERSFTHFIDGIYGHTNATPTVNSPSTPTDQLLIAQ